MNKNFLILYSMLFCGLVSCSGAGKLKETVQAVEKTDSCKLDSKNKYEVYIPVRENSDEKLPLLVIIDAHGNGKFALDKFKQGAMQYPAVIIASDLIKNGYEDSDVAIQNLIDDVHKKYPVGETVFMTGFSGGARMVLGYALFHQVNGLILCGALAGPDQMKALHCPVISISGMDDFNFMETAQYLFQESSTPGNLTIELTNASHSWPDSPVLSNAMGFLRLSVHTADIPSLPESLLKKYCQYQQTRISSLKQHGDLLKATLVARNMAQSKPFNNDKAFTSTYNTLKTDPAYISQLKQLGKCLDVENSKRQPYLDAFRTKDTRWWKNEIITIDEKIKTEKDSYTRDIYSRIKGFLGIIVYTYCKQAVKDQNAETLNKLLFIYKMLDPQNPDRLYFSSFQSYWKGNNEVTITTLKKAINAGYSDIWQLKNDFPESITSKLN